MLLLLTMFILSTVEEALQVIGENVNSVQGRTAILPCKLIDAKDSLTQIAWRKDPEEENFILIKPDVGMKFTNKVDERFYFFGDVSDYNGSLRLSNITLRDEGTYTCIFTLFPIGNVQTKILLNVLVPPITSLEDHRPTLGNEEVPLVTCKAAASKPAAEVRWLKGTLGEKVTETTNVTRHDNGTTTTVSSLSGVPSREMYNHLVQCIVTNAALSQEERLPFNIQIYFPPIEVNISKESENAFECETEANPNADFIWSRSDQTMLQSTVRVEGPTLRFGSMTSDLNGLYQCEASNFHGKKHSYIYVHVTSEACPACWTLFGISLLIILVGVAALGYMWKLSKAGQVRTDMERRGPVQEAERLEVTGLASFQARREDANTALSKTKCSLINSKSIQKTQRGHGLTRVTMNNGTTGYTRHTRLKYTEVQVIGHRWKQSDNHRTRQEVMLAQGHKNMKLQTKTGSRTKP